MEAVLLQQEVIWRQYPPWSFWRRLRVGKGGESHSFWFWGGDHSSTKLVGPTKSKSYSHKPKWRSHKSKLFVSWVFKSASSILQDGRHRLQSKIGSCPHLILHSQWGRKWDNGDYPPREVDAGTRWSWYDGDCCTSPARRPFSDFHFVVCSLESPPNI
jgi:hypothetical protein